jgi:hypothetical protein
MTMKRIISVFLAIATLTIIANGADLSKPHHFVNPTGKQFPIMTWHSVPANEATPERYREMADAGFNMSFSNFEKAEQLEKALKACDGTGIKLMAACGELHTKTAETIKRFKGNKNVAGWFLRDEPICDGFPDMTKLADSIRTADDSHVLYLNLLPYTSGEALHCKDYRDYVARFIKEVGIGLVSFDMYPVITNGGYLHLKKEYYETLETISSEAAKAGQPFWAFSLSTPHSTFESQYPVPTRHSLRLQIFSDLAYGAQGIQYFTYWNPGKSDFVYYNAPITDGVRTEVWDMLGELNREVQRLSWVFLGDKVVNVAHTGDSIPIGTKPLTSLPRQITEVKSSGTGVLVSQLQNGKNHFLMVVNRDIVNRQQVTVKTTPTVNRVMPSGKTVKASLYSSSLWLDPGDYLLYQWTE